MAQFPLTCGVAGWLIAENLTWIPQIKRFGLGISFQTLVYLRTKKKVNFLGNVQEVQQEIFQKKDSNQTRCRYGKRLLGVEDG